MSKIADTLFFMTDIIFLGSLPNLFENRLLSIALIWSITMSQSSINLQVPILR